MKQQKLWNWEQISSQIENIAVINSKKKDLIKKN